jgi:hypothetical protein
VHSHDLGYVVPDFKGYDVEGGGEGLQQSGYRNATRRNCVENAQRFQREKSAIGSA